MLSSFESITVSICAAPGKNLPNLKPNTTSAEFQKCVNQLKNKILDQMSQPRNIGTTVINFHNVDRLVHKLAKQLENGDIIRVKSAVKQYQHEQINKARRCFEENLREAYKKVDLAVTDGLEEQLTQLKIEHLESFKVSTDHIDLKPDTLQDELDDFAKREMAVKKKEIQLVMENNQLREKGVLMNNT